MDSNMGRKKKIKEVEIKETIAKAADNDVTVVSQELAIKLENESIGKISEDFGREDINTIARKINEIIDRVNK